MGASAGQRNLPTLWRGGGVRLRRLSSLGGCGRGKNSHASRAQGGGGEQTHGSGAATIGVGDDLNAAILVHTHAGVGGTKVLSDGGNGMSRSETCAGSTLILASFPASRGLAAPGSMMHHAKLTACGSQLRAITGQVPHNANRKSLACHFSGSRCLFRCLVRSPWKQRAN